MYDLCRIWTEQKDAFRLTTSDQEPAHVRILRKGDHIDSDISIGMVSELVITEFTDDDSFIDFHKQRLNEMLNDAGYVGHIGSDDSECKNIKNITKYIYTPLCDAPSVEEKDEVMGVGIRLRRKPQEHSLNIKESKESHTPVPTAPAPTAPATQSEHPQTAVITKSELLTYILMFALMFVIHKLYDVIPTNYLDTSSYSGKTIALIISSLLALVCSFTETMDCGSNWCECNHAYTSACRNAILNSHCFWKWLRVFIKYLAVVFPVVAAEIAIAGIEQKEG